MKNPRLSLLTVGLLAILLASACAPAASSSPTAPVDASATPVSQPTAEVVVPNLTVQPEATLAPTEAAALPVATSRGPGLEATDPSSVSFASGGLQLVEFFRFT
ncbi:MAG: hypothetical protein C4583_08175 [Anaerolineaceae bacterium]|nr:MAG: hypothetical protein C4583_08175 [Anaerolineaceae bacterium]